MGASSSKPKKSKITSQDKAILDLKIQRDKLNQYQKKIQAVLDREYEIAKINLKNGDKKKALLALKKKKYQEQLIEKVDAQLLNIEELTNSIEYAVVEKEVLDGLKNGNEILKQLNNEMNIEKVEELMNETAEAVAYQNEISELLSGALTVEDEEAIENELAQLQEEELNNKLPDVPTTELPSVNEQEKVEESEEEEETEEKKQKVKTQKKTEPELIAA